jgi:eukaryotic-like serine/threonine-protein kinase
MPFDGDTPAAIMFACISTQVRSPAHVRPGIPGALDGAVMKAIALRREDRYATLPELIDALEQSGALALDWSAGALGTSSETAPAGRVSMPRNTTPGQTQSFGRPRSRVALLVGVAILLGIAAASSLLLRSGAAPPQASRPAELPAPAASIAPVAPVIEPEPDLPFAPEPREEVVPVVNKPKPKSARRVAPSSEPQVVTPPRVETSAPAAPAVHEPSHRSGTLRREDL